MKTNKISIALLASFLTFGMSSCLSDGEDTINLGNKVEVENPLGVDTRTVSTNEYAVLSGSGYTMTIPMGSVPPSSNGSAGRVAFSISPVSELPAPLPDNAVLVPGTSAVKIEPFAFTFATPLTIQFDFPGTASGRNAMLHYNEEYGRWENVPYSNLRNGTATISVIELGYFAHVQYPENKQYGGIKVLSEGLDPSYCYYLNIISENSQIKRIAFGNNSQPVYMANLPIGSYTIQLAREHRNGLSSQSESIEYTYPQTVNVRSTLVPGNGGYETYLGWTVVSANSLSWNVGRPSAWGSETTTYGTGTFQATLTWINGNNSGSTDYDLHLFGPNSVHVFFSNKNEGGFELDRDWLTESGNAIENIYTVSENIPTGEYQIKVHHFSGSLGKRYNCRVILNGVVIKSVSGFISTNKQYDEICSFNIGAQ